MAVGRVAEGHLAAAGALGRAAVAPHEVGRVVGQNLPQPGQPFLFGAGPRNARNRGRPRASFPAPGPRRPPSAAARSRPAIGPQSQDTSGTARTADPDTRRRPAGRPRSAWKSGPSYLRSWSFPNLEPQRLDHTIVFGRRLALGRQIVADEDRVGRIEAQRLQRAKVHLATGGNPQLAAGIGQPEQGQHLQAIARVRAGGRLPAACRRSAAEN